MASHRRSAQYETSDSLTFIVSQFSSPSTPRKLLSEKKRDVLDPDILWRLKVYPNGNGTAGFLALYVDIPSKHSLPEDWSCSRDITFTLHHPTDPSKSIFKHTSHTFNDEEPDWGYNQVIPISALSQRGFLSNDCIKVTATFRVPETNAEPVAVPAGQTGLTPKPSQTPELTAPKSPAPPGVTPHEFNERDECKVVIEEFSKATCKPVACAWHPFNEDSKFEWRLIVYPRAGPEAVSAYIDVRAKDVNDDKWEQTVSGAIFLDNVDNPDQSIRYSFVKVFKAAKSRKGFPILSLVPILTKEGFLSHDKLVVSATAKIEQTPKTELPKKLPTVVDAIVMEVHGFLSYDGSTPDSCMIVSPWHKLEGLGRWRFTLYPAGTKNNTGKVSAVVAFQPSDELIGTENNWQIRVICEASAVKKNEKQEQVENKEDTDARIAVLDSLHMKVTLDNVISVQKVIEQKNDYLKWDSTFDDDDTLRVRVLFRTCGPSGPKTFVSKQAMDVCMKNVETGIAAVKQALTEADKPLLDNVSQSAVSWDASMRELEEAFKKQMDLLATLGSELEYQDKFDTLNRKLAALKEEEEVCTGKGLPVEELNAKEQEMRSTLKKLLLMQTTGCENNNPVDEVNGTEEKKPQESEPIVIPKSSISVDDVLSRHSLLLANVHGLVEQCERVCALSNTLCHIRSELEQYMKQVEQWIAEQTKKHEEFVVKEKELEAKCKEAERKNKILRGEDAVLKTLTMDEVTRYVDFVMEAVGQVAVAKYLTKKE